jgi:hypothetical protein
MYRPGLQSSTGNGHGVLLKRLASSKKHTLVLCFDVVSYNRRLDGFVDIESSGYCNRLLIARNGIMPRPE